MKKAMILIVLALLLISCLTSTAQSVDELYSQYPSNNPNELWNVLDDQSYDEVPLLPPTEYYQAIDNSSPGELWDSLHDLISGHEKYRYSVTGHPNSDGWRVDTWDIIAIADQHPEYEDMVLDLYRNRTFERNFSGSGYDREHSWPNSRGFPSDYNIAFTDVHALFACDSGYNRSRNDSFYGLLENNDPNIEKCTDDNLGRGGHDDCNFGWTDVDDDTRNDLWQVWSGRQGDVARALFYMALRYEGDVENEPDLQLTNDIAEQLSACQDCYRTGGVAYMGLLNTLLKWHENDPVDNHERRRNTVIYLFQGNRNPFVDNPEWVSLIF